MVFEILLDFFHNLNKTHIKESCGFGLLPGPALKTVRSRALPLTASCLSPLSSFESHPGHVRKLPVTWG